MPDLPPSAPGTRPVVGHTLAFLRAPLAALQRWADTDDGVVTVRVAGRRLCLVTDPAAVRSVLVTDADSYEKAQVVRDRLDTLQGGSLVLLEGTQWRERRQLLQSGVTHERVAAVGSLTTQYTAEMVAEWPTDRPVRADNHARDLSLAILARALFGLDIRGERTPIHDAADDILARMDMQSVSTYLPEWVPTPTNRRFRRAVATLHDRLDTTVERRAETDNPSTDLLSAMLAAGLDPETIRDELVAFLFAGFDSTATALSCTLGLLGSHPDVQAALHSELDSVLDGAAPTPADLDEMSLLDAVVKESLRLYPPQYVLFREPTTTVTLDGYQVGPGTTVLLAPWTLHRDARFWADPASFRPRRWLDADGDSRPESSYIPYGAGPRLCLGVRLAAQTLRLVVAVLCQHRRLSATGELSVSAGPTLSLDGGVELQTHRRSSR